MTVMASYVATLQYGESLASIRGTVFVYVSTLQYGEDFVNWRQPIMNTRVGQDQYSANGKGITSPPNAGGQGNGEMFGYQAASSTTGAAFGANSASTGANSVAFGQSAVGSGDGSVANGAGATASNTNTLAVGIAATASAAGAIAIGGNSSSASASSIAFGSGASVGTTAINCTAIGNGASIGNGATSATLVGASSSIGTLSTFTVLVGASSTIAGMTTACVLVGENSTINTGANCSVLIGAGASVTADGGGGNATAVGFGTTITGSYSVAVGYQAAAAQRGIAIGAQVTALANTAVIGPVNDIQVTSGGNTPLRAHNDNVGTWSISGTTGVTGLFAVCKTADVGDIAQQYRILCSRLSAIGGEGDDPWVLWINRT